MLAGRDVWWNRIELLCKLSSSISSTDFTTVGAIAGGKLLTSDCPAYNVKQDGISIDLVGEQDPIHTAGQMVVTITIAALSYSYSATVAGAPGSQSGMVAINNYKKYCQGGVFLEYWDSIEIWANGTLITTLGSGSLMSSFNTPVGVPLLGVCATVSGAVSPNPSLVVGVPPAYNFVQDNHVSASAVITGGWRVREFDLGIWTAWPVNLRYVPLPAGGGCDASASVATVSASNTYNVNITCHAYQQLATTDNGLYTCYCNPADHSIGTPSITHVWQTTAESDRNNGSVTLVPNLAKGVNRIAADYAAFIARGGFPQALGASSYTCYDGTHEPPDPTVSTVEFYPRLGADKRRVTNAYHSIEYPFTVDSYAPYSTNGYAQKGRSTYQQVIQPGSCPVDGGGA